MPNPFLVMMAVGEGLQAIGKVKANLDQADAEERNAAFYREQSEWARIAGERDEELLAREAEQIRGQQVVAFASSGAAFGASEAHLMAQTQERVRFEATAIRERTRQRMREALLKASVAEGTAGSLRDPVNNVLSVGGGLLTGAGNIAYMARKE